jgi:hypothetical protein
VAAPIAGVVAGVVSVAKGIGAVTGAFDDIDRIAKAADALGLTTEDMVGLEHAAELSGVSTEALGNAMQKAVRKGTDLFTIADKIAAAESPTERAKIAFDELGRSGQDLIPLLSEGGDAIRAMMAEGSALAGFSREDAAKVEEANDALSRMQLAFTGIAREAAIALAPAVDLIAVGVQKVGEWGRQAFTDLQSFAVDAFLTMEFGWQNMGAIATVAWDTIKLGAIGFYEDTKFMFTDQLPAVLTWFAENWDSILFTAIDYALTLFINLGQNIRNLWSAVLEFISGNGFNFDWTPLTEGAVSAISQLPEIPERVATEAEKQLTAAINANTTRLIDGVGEHVLAGREAILGKPGEETAPAPGTGADITGKVKGDLKGAGAFTAGSSDAFSSILANMRNASQDPNAEVAKNTKEQLAETKKQTAIMRQQKSQQTVELVAVRY